MVNFIKISSVLINTNHINKILIKPDKYYIYIFNLKIYGFYGSINSHDEPIEVCANTMPKDYKNISNWINQYK
jgi:hypothetical protein